MNKRPAEGRGAWQRAAAGHGPSGPLDGGGADEDDETICDYDPLRLNTASLTGVVVTPPVTTAPAATAADGAGSGVGDGEAPPARVTRAVLMSLCDAASPGVSEPIEVEARAGSGGGGGGGAGAGGAAAAAALAAARVGEVLLVGGRLGYACAAAAAAGGGEGRAAGEGGGAARRARLALLADGVWRVAPESIPAGACAAAYDGRFGGAPSGGWTAAALRASGGGGATPSHAAGGGGAGGGAPPPPPPRPLPALPALVGQFNAPGGSFVEMAALYGLPAVEVIAVLSEGGAALDWPKLAHEAEQYASDGEVAAAEVAAAAGAWAGANPGGGGGGAARAAAVARLGEALLADPRLGPRLRRVEAEAGGGGAEGAAVLAALWLGAWGAGVPLL
ncbi:MAG: hypothetical protein J3K34DRAFT_489968 [Monoraphidium minutum]|nr:MAG: hypothetical protein J3K34DRAFT_489968 [Monoraphidium minutum]